MSKRGALNARYPHILPVHHVVLPELILHNPISWVWFGWKFISQWPSVTKTTVEWKDGLFLVHDPRDMMRLWDEGFFGKGTLSRSEPSWLDRTQKRLGIGKFKNLTIEEITSIRREERKKFKKERAKLEKKQQELKKQGVVDPLLEDKLKLRELRDKDINVRVERETHVRPEDDALVNEGELVNIEELQLQPCETFFLKFALQCVDVVLDSNSLNSEELLDLIWNHRADDQFILNYVVYHHYRSLGWCVRSAVKFGTDFLLYKRGPPFHHAEFALSVIPNHADDSKNHETARNFTWLSGLNRVVAGVRKNLVLVFVDVPSQEQIDGTTDILQLLELYKISEVLYRRWVPNRNRD